MSRAADAGADPRVRSDGAVLARGLAIAAALAASLFDPRKIGESDHDFALLFGVGGLGVSIALLALKRRLPAPRNLAAALLLPIGGAALVVVSVLALVFATIAMLVSPSGSMAAPAFAWLLAIVLNQWESRRAFAVARRLFALRLALFAVGMAVLLPSAALWAGTQAQGIATEWLHATPAESLAPGIGVLAGAALLLAAALLAWRIPVWLARGQLHGQIAASAAGEAIWFASLAALLLPIALQGAVALEKPLSIWTTLDGEQALQTLLVIAAHGLVRLGFDRVGSPPPVPLVLLLPHDMPKEAARRLCARLPRLWGAGAVTRVLPPLAALHEHGVHLRLAEQAGAPAAVPATPDRFSALLGLEPPAHRWRALPVREIYMEPAHWCAWLRAALSPQTWTLLVEDRAAKAARWPAELAALLPPDRSLRVDLVPDGVSDDDGWPASLAHLPRWTGPSSDRRAAGDLARWLRERAQPGRPRRLLLLHAHAERGLADRLAAQLSGRHDASGRYVEAAAIGCGERTDWSMPIGSFRTVQQVHLRALAAVWSVMGLHDAVSRPALWVVERLFHVRAAEAPEPYDVIVLNSPALHRELAPAAMPRIAQEARRRLALQLDFHGPAPFAIDAQLTADDLHAPALADLVDRMLADDWVGVSLSSGTPPPAAAMGGDAVPAATEPLPRVLLLASAAADEPDAVAMADAFVRALTGRVDVRRRVPDDDDADDAAGSDLLVVLATPGLASHPRLDRWLYPVWSRGLPGYRIDVVRAGGDAAHVEALAGLERLNPEGGTFVVGPDGSGPPPALLDSTAQRLLDALRAAGEPGTPAAGAGGPDGSPGRATWEVTSPVPLTCALALGEGGIVAGLVDGSLLVTPRLIGAPPDVLPMHRSAVRALLARPDGRIVSAGDDGTLGVWNLASLPGPSGRLVRIGDAVVALAALRSGDFVGLVGAARDGTLRLWPSADVGETPPLAELNDEALGRDVPRGLHGTGSDDRVYAACGVAGVIEIRIEGTRLQTRGVPSQAPWPGVVGCVHATPTTLYAGGHDSAGRGALRCLPRSTGSSAAVRWLDGLPAPVVALAALADDELAYALADGRVGIWSPAAGANVLRHVAYAASPVVTLVALAGDLLAIVRSDRVAAYPTQPAHAAA
jgi:hypothetical protein